MLAIVIPYFKITFFEETLHSLSIQIDKRFKVYIGDDASPENPAVYKGQFEFVYCRFEENLGSISLAQQWNRCIALTAAEEWLMVLGDDDSLSPTCIEDFYTHLPKIIGNHCTVVRYATEVNDVIHQNRSPIYTHPELEKITDFFCRRIANVTRSSLSEYVFKKEAYLKYNFHNYDWAWYAYHRAWLEFSDFGTIYTINTYHLIIGLSDQNISRASIAFKNVIGASEFITEYGGFTAEYLSLHQIVFYIKEYYKNRNLIRLHGKNANDYLIANHTLNEKLNKDLKSKLEFIIHN